MAKLTESIAIIKISRMLRDSDEAVTETDLKVFAQIEEVLNELVNDDKHAMIEVIYPDDE